jgi:hypothetical protein
MLLKYLLLLPFGAFASPIASEESVVQQNQDLLAEALADFGNENFTWPELDLPPVYHPSLAVSKEEGIVDTTDILEPTDVFPFDVVETPEQEASKEPDAEDNPLSAETVEPEQFDFGPVKPKPTYVLKHDANDNPADPDKDIYHVVATNLSRPICGYFQHSVLGQDFGESTFPRISYVGAELLPYRVHYAPDDNLRFEAYKWPFAACNRGCELQALKIRALFDWELDPVNPESNLDEETKKALTLAREICQWKNVHHHFSVNDCSSLTKRDQIPASPEKVIGEHQIWKGIPASALQNNAQQQLVSGEAQAALQEIRNIFLSAKSPADLADMFNTVIVACQIHRYSSSPMKALAITSTENMVQNAMAQVENVFLQTQGRIDVWETRDAIVRATQIYRYQEEQSP